LRDAAFACPDLTTFCRLDQLGLEVAGQRLDPDRAVLACRVVGPDGSDEDRFAAIAATTTAAQVSGYRPGPAPPKGH
jgi:hypothetical protein